MEEYGMVTISLDEYNALVRTKTKYEILLNTLFNASRIGYDKNYLLFEYTEINTALKNMENDDYEAVIDTLIHEEALKQEEEKNGNV